MYKMIAIDVDDTLLDDHNKVSEPTKEALAKAVDKGIIVTLATGRMFASAQQIAKQINLNVPLITYQGSLVKNLLDEEILYERSIPKHISEFLFEYCAKNGYHLQGYYNDELYAKEVNDRLLDYCRNSNVPYKLEPDFEKLTQYPMTKLLIFDEPARLDHITEELTPQIGAEIHITKSKPFFLEFLHKEGTKGQALSFLASHYGCQLSEVIAVGDSWNDHDMLQMAGLGVAMNNAVEPLKEIADYITASNNEDGVKQVIDKFLLK